MLKTIKFVQVVIAPFDGASGRTYSTLALGRDGNVYRFDVGCQGWIMMPAVKAGCKGHRRYCLA